MPLAFRTHFRKNVRLRLGRRSRRKSRWLDGKPEAFRTGGGKAAYYHPKGSYRYLVVEQVESFANVSR